MTDQTPTTAELIARHKADAAGYGPAIEKWGPDYQNFFARHAIAARDLHIATIAALERLEDLEHPAKADEFTDAAGTTLPRAEVERNARNWVDEIFECDWRGLVKAYVAAKTDEDLLSLVTDDDGVFEEANRG